MRWLLALAAALLLAGCGSATPEGAGAPVVPDTSAPPIVATDEAPPDDVSWFLQSEFAPDDLSGDSGQSIGVCEVEIRSASELSPPPDASDNSCPQPTAEEQARMRAAEQQYEQAIRPAPDSEPRVIARLPLGDSGGALLFTAWKSSSGKTCWETDESGADFGGGSGPSGPCGQDAADAFPASAAYGPSCDVICLSSDSSGDGDGPDSYVLSGTVPRDAEALRVTVADGSSATYPLLGPQVLDTQQRVFMLDLGTQDWRKLELIRRGRVTTTTEMPALITAYEECSLKIGPPTAVPVTADDPKAILDAMQPYESALNACLSASGAWPSMGLPQAQFP